MANSVSASTATNAGIAYATIAAHTAGTGLSGSTFNGSTAQTWTLNTATLMASSVAIAGGTTGQLHYQSAANTTGFVGPGTAGQFLQSAGASAPTYVSTTTMYVQRAVQADSAAGGSAQVNTQAQPTNATYYAAFVSANNASATAMSVYTTGTFIINPATGQVGINTSSLSTSSKLTVLGRVESVTDPSGEGGQFVMRSPGYGYRWSIDNYYGAMRIIREDDVTEASGASIVTITSGTNSIMVVGGTTGYSGEKFAVNGGTYHNGITTMTNSIYVTGGNVGVGQSSAVAKLDVAGTIRTEFFGTDTSTPADVMNITGNGVARALGTGATLTFTAPANTDGTNMWAQARIIGGGDNNSNGDANGAMMLQTRSLYVPSGGSGSWNWRTGITIRASGAIAFGNGGTAYGSSGQVLQSNGNASPSWVSPSSLAAASATQVSTQAQAANANYYPVFVSANNASATAMSEYTTSSFYINPATGQHYISTPGSTALAINVNSGSDRYFLTCTGAVNSFSIYENGNTAYLNSYNNMSIRVNQNGGSGGNLLISGGSVMIGTGTPGAPLSFTDATGLKIQLNANAANYYAIEKQAAVNSGDSLFKYNAGQTSAGEHGFYSGGTLKFLIDANGKVGINRVAPAARLHLVGVGATTSEIVARFAKGSYADTGGHTCLIGLSNEPATWSKGAIGWTRTGSYDTGYFGIYVNSATDTTDINTATDARLLASTSGIQIANALGVGTAASGTTGEIRATNEITAYYSDRRLKENVKVIDNAVTKVLSLNGITYTPNELAASFGYDQNVKLVGLFADEVEAVLPEATRPAPFDQDEDGNSKSGENYKTIQYEKLVPLLVEAIKEQQQTINDQNSRIEKLELLVKNLAGKYSE